jgi:hypothetical protein
MQPPLYCIIVYYIRLRLEVGIEAQNLELELAGTNTVVWMSLELRIRIASEYQMAFASLACTLQQIGAPTLGITRHSPVVVSPPSSPHHPLSLLELCRRPPPPRDPPSGASFASRVATSSPSSQAGGRCPSSFRRDPVRLLLMCRG